MNSKNSAEKTSADVNQLVEKLWLYPDYKATRGTLTATTALRKVDEIGQKHKKIFKTGAIFWEKALCLYICQRSYQKALYSSRTIVHAWIKVKPH